MNTAVSARSSSIACAKPVTCWPSTASRPTWPYASALRIASVTRIPVSARPSTVGIATRTTSRQATRQFRRASAEPAPAGKAPGSAASAELDWLIARPR